MKKKNKYFGYVPSDIAHATDVERNSVETASHPWSNNSPMGDEVLVRLACFPSIASSVWYRNKPIAQRKNT